MNKVFQGVISVAILFILLGSCSKNKSNIVITNKTDSVQEHKRFVDLIMKDYDKVSGLSCLKYGIQKVDADTILKEYIKYYEPDMYSLITKNKIDIDNKQDTKEDLCDFAERMSIKTGVSTQIISSYLYDLILYDKVCKRNDNY